MDNMLCGGSEYAGDLKFYPPYSFGIPKFVEFEGDYKVPIPNNVDAVLCAQFGNFMELPPVSQRTPKHQLNADEVFHGR